jgi:hypothetical protein
MTARDMFQLQPTSLQHTLAYDTCCDPASGCFSSQVHISHLNLEHCLLLLCSVELLWEYSGVSPTSLLVYKTVLRFYLGMQPSKGPVAATLRCGWVHSLDC